MTLNQNIVSWTVVVTPRTRPVDWLAKQSAFASYYYYITEIGFFMSGAAHKFERNLYKKKENHDSQRNCYIDVLDLTKQQCSRPCVAHPRFATAT